MFSSVIGSLTYSSNILADLSTKTVEAYDTSFVSSVLLLLILSSLVLTFHNKGTTVHKVLGLLLLSIFVVFLWILQTQFLFIYIVYILAFISAVLMLFLSVVLMLPISTLTSKNLSTDKKGSYSVALFCLQDLYITETIVIAALVIVMLLYFIYVVLQYKNYLNNLPKFELNTQLRLISSTETLYDLHQYAWSRFRPESLPHTFYQNKLENRFYLIDTVYAYPTIKENHSSKTNQLYKKYIQTIGLIWAYLVHYLQLWSSKNTTAISLFFNSTAYTLLMATIYFWTLIDLFLRLMLNAVVYTYLVVRKTTVACFMLLFTKVGMPKDTSKIVTDTLVQTYLFVSIVGGLVVALATKQTWFADVKHVPNLELSQGLGQIKTLLYGEFSSFLLISTIVLLVALLGAAVMTRSNRK